MALTAHLTSPVALPRVRWVLGQAGLVLAGILVYFGVRGLKILLDGIPQTLPDGQGATTERASWFRYFGLSIPWVKPSVRSSSSSEAIAPALSSRVRC